MLHVRRPGFTLIELSVVIGMVSILSGAGYVAFSGYKKQARLAEPIANTHAIYALQLAHPAGPIPCEASPAEVPKRPVDWVSVGGFRELGFSPGSFTRFQYEVVVDESSNFVVRARGDLDGDGDTSLFELSSQAPDLVVVGATE